VDSDGYDDLILFTGAGVWHSARGQFPWRHLAYHVELPHEVLVGKFLDGQKCDALKVNRDTGIAFVSSGVTETWLPVGKVDKPATDLRVFRRKGIVRDGVFRAVNDQWQFRFFGIGNPNWTNLAVSDVPIKKLVFGDLIGSGGTDIAFFGAGKWYVSRAGETDWQEISAGNTHSVAAAGDLNGGGWDDLIEIRLTASNLVGSLKFERLRYSAGGIGTWQPIAVAVAPIMDSAAGDANFSTMFFGNFLGTQSQKQLLIIEKYDRMGYLVVNDEPTVRAWSSMPY
jgi:hypothetical protein